LNLFIKSIFWRNWQHSVSITSNTSDLWLS